MNRCTRQSSCQSAQPHFACLKDCETRSDNGHISLIEISERLGGGLTNQALSDAPTCIATLLNRHLSDTRQWLSVLLERSSIPYYIYVWMSGNREVVLNADAAGAVRLDVQPFTCWRRRYSCGPDDHLTCDTLSADENPVRVDLVNAVPQTHFYAKIFQPVLSCLGELRSESPQDPRRHVHQHDACRREVDSTELPFQLRADEHCK